MNLEEAKEFRKIFTKFLQNTEMLKVFINNHQFIKSFDKLALEPEISDPRTIHIIDEYISSIEGFIFPEIIELNLDYIDFLRKSSEFVFNHKECIDLESKKEFIQRAFKSYNKENDKNPQSPIMFVKSKSKKIKKTPILKLGISKISKDYKNYKSKNSIRSSNGSSYISKIRESLIKESFSNKIINLNKLIFINLIFFTYKIIIILNKFERKINYLSIN